MKLTEEAAIAALKASFEGRYVLTHPMVGSNFPDAVTVTIEPFEISGFEIKTTRQDWLHELKTGKNSCSIAACDFWSIIGDTEIVRIEDLPREWGLYRVIEGHLICEVEPNRLKPRTTLDRSLASTILKSILGSIPLTETTRRIRDQAYKEVFDEINGRPVFVQMTAKRLTAFARLLEEREHERIVRKLQAIKSDVAWLYEHIDRCLSSVSPEADWESGKEFSPEAIVWGEQTRKRLLANPRTGEFFRLKPHLLEAAVQSSMRTFSGF